MSTIDIRRVSLEQQVINTQLLSDFEFAFSSNDCKNIFKMLHPDGLFFNKNNRYKACGVFFNIFFGEQCIDKNFHMEVNRGVTIDKFPGEVVLEFRSSDIDPFTNDVNLINKKFGEKPDQRIKEVVHVLAFSFKDNKIFTIRIPGKCVSENAIQNQYN
jgi:hypothetical protein